MPSQPTPLDRIIHPNERVALFIDGANLYSATRGLSFDIDYKKLLEEFKKRGRFIRAAYYTALVENDDFSSIRPLVDWLDYNGFSLVTKPAREFTDSMGRRRFKGDMDMEIAMDMIDAAAFADHQVLFSGDGDFTALVHALKRRGVKTTVISTIKSNPPSIADELRRAADNFLDLADLAAWIGRPPRERAPMDSGRDNEEDDGAS